LVPERHDEPMDKIVAEDDSISWECKFEGRLSKENNVSVRSLDELDEFKVILLWWNEDVVFARNSLDEVDGNSDDEALADSIVRCACNLVVTGMDVKEILSSDGIKSIPFVKTCMTLKNSRYSII
jgi:hypothetical protein